MNDPFAGFSGNTLVCRRSIIETNSNSTPATLVTPGLLRKLKRFSLERKKQTDPPRCLDACTTIIVLFTCRGPFVGRLDGMGVLIEPSCGFIGGADFLTQNRCHQLAGEDGVK